jgi:serine/threonine protein kinase
MVRELGRGGFGHVSLVRNTITNAHAAIKVLKNDRIKSSSDIDMIFR